MATSKKTITCNKCGATGLVWATTKAGKYYLTDAESTAITGEGGKTIKTLQLAHKCKSAEELEIETGFQQAADKAHALEAQRDELTAQILELLNDSSQAAEMKARELTAQAVALRDQIADLQNKYNKGWKF